MPSKLYNFSNEGECSWFDFGSEIVKISRMSCIVNPIKTIDYPLPAKRPKNSILDKRLISEEFDLNIRHWKESLKNCLENL